MRLAEQKRLLLELTNWRPITLLNVDFKIDVKAIAECLESILPFLIHSDQTGFVKKHNDIMETTKSQNLPDILTSLDFRKAFDSLEWPFIMKSLDYFECGGHQGYTTNWFKPSKGVRQVWPLSRYRFILSAELLSNKIRQDSTVKGIKVFGNEIKLSQLADDTTLFNDDFIVEKGTEKSR